MKTIDFSRKPAELNGMLDEQLAGRELQQRNTPEVLELAGTDLRPMTGTMAEHRSGSRLICGGAVSWREHPVLVVGRRIVAPIAFIGEEAPDDVTDERLHIRDNGFKCMAW